ncbi:MAG: hypothetical protein KIT27_10920 [Legionellales bacterium]|nr:hypothetical protein [Legionellales bacterium]
MIESALDHNADTIQQAKNQLAAAKKITVKDGISGIGGSLAGATAYVYDLLSTKENNDRFHQFEGVVSFSDNAAQLAFFSASEIRKFIDLVIACVKKKLTKRDLVKLGLDSATAAFITWHAANLYKNLAKDTSALDNELGENIFFLVGALLYYGPVFNLVQQVKKLSTDIFYHIMTLMPESSYRKQLIRDRELEKCKNYFLKCAEMANSLSTKIVPDNYASLNSAELEQAILNNLFKTLSEKDIIVSTRDGLWKSVDAVLFYLYVTSNLGSFSNTVEKTPGYSGYVAVLAGIALGLLMVDSTVKQLQKLLKIMQGNGSLEFLKAHWKIVLAVALGIGISYFTTTPSVTLTEEQIDNVDWFLKLKVILGTMFANAFAKTQIALEVRHKWYLLRKNTDVEKGELLKIWLEMLKNSKDEKQFINLMQNKINDLCRLLPEDEQDQKKSFELLFDEDEQAFETFHAPKKYREALLKNSAYILLFNASTIVRIMFQLGNEFPSRALDVATPLMTAIVEFYKKNQNSQEVRSSLTSGKNKMSDPLLSSPDDKNDENDEKENGEDIAGAGLTSSRETTPETSASLPSQAHPKSSTWLQLASHCMKATVPVVLGSFIGAMCKEAASILFGVENEETLQNVENSAQLVTQTIAYHYMAKR